MTPTPLSDQQRVDWLRLARTPGVGPVTFASLIARFGSAGEAIAALPGLDAKRARTVPEAGVIEGELEAAAAIGARVLCSCESDYSDLLRELGPPPPVITVRGRVELLNTRTLAMVGARDASAAGRKIARDMARALGAAGLTTVSGLARGIDGEVHAASLETGTIAVLGGGVDHIYPPQHRDLYTAVAERGLIVSESPLGHRAQARDFPRRNRIITGLSLGVVVVEAAERSGSLISARTAGEQNREVMAVPGSPLDTRASGTNRLLREGAILVRHADDVIEAVTSLSQNLFRAPVEPFAFDLSDGDVPRGDVERVLAALSPAPMGRACCTSLWRLKAPELAR